MRLLAYISGSNTLEAEFLSGNTIYAPKAAYPEQERYTLLRSPHIARNEEALVQPLKTVGTIWGEVSFPSALCVDGGFPLFDPGPTRRCGL